MKILCSCGRGSYDSDRPFASCYECYKDRRMSYDTCIVCGSWHNPTFALCYKCRSGDDKEQKEDAAMRMRELIFALDDGACCECGATAALQIDHIEPVKHGGRAQPWNLQTMCRTCVIAKDGRWSSHADATLIARMMDFYCSSILMDIMQGNEEAELVAKMDKLTGDDSWRRRPAPVHDGSRVTEAMQGMIELSIDADRYVATEDLPAGTKANEIGACGDCGGAMVRYGERAQGTLCHGCKAKKEAKKALKSKKGGGEE